MAWKPYQDQQNRAYSSILTTLFPEQTKTLPRILVWSVIFLLDLTLCLFGALHFGLLQLDSYRNTNQMALGTLPLLAAVVGIFWLQGVIWGWITKFFKKRKENRNVSL